MCKGKTQPSGKRGLFRTIYASLSLLTQCLSRKKIAELLFFSILGSLLPAVIVSANKYIIDVAELLANGKSTLRVALLSVALYTLAGLALAGVGWLRDKFVALYFAQTADQLQENIMRKSSRIRMAYYDDISYRNKVSFSSVDLPERIRSLIVTSVMLLQDGITAVSLALTISTVSGWTAVLTFCGFAPLMGVILRQSRANFAFQKESFPDVNKQSYLHTTTYRRYHLFDLRYYCLRDFVEGKWNDISQSLNQKRSKLILKYFWLRLAANSFLYLCIGAGLLLTVRRILNGSATIGGIALILSAVISLAASISGFFERLGVIEENGQYVDSYYELLDLEDEAPGKTKLGPDLDITFDHVCFTYPHSKRQVLHDITLHIRQGEKIAIVGENGSGKSTFVSLLSGFYPIDSGEIQINGVPIGNCLEDMRAKTSCLYQSSESYIMTAHENIEIGDSARRVSREELEALGRKTGMDEVAAGLTDGYDTVIGNLGTNNTFDLSGGQRQKMFLTRALLRESARLLILDEPTSALDPMAEAKLYEDFSSLAGDRTCILISHRLGATKLADRILVFRDGHIIEEGTHEGLIAQGGYYKQMYAAQAQWYK